MKKTWTEPLIDAANRAQTRHEKKLRAILRTIIRFKTQDMPDKVLDELGKVLRKSRLVWWSGPRQASTWYKVMKQYKVQLPDSFVPAVFARGPHLSSTQALLVDHELYLWDLIPKLRNPEWVAALRECPGCRKLLMSSVKWENKFCSPQCKKRNWARVHRKRVRCPGLKGIRNDQITLLDCKQAQKKEPHPECQTCPFSMKKRREEPDMKKGGDHESRRI